MGQELYEQASAAIPEKLIQRFGWQEDLTADNHARKGRHISHCSD